jgi:hypothetical protein
MTEQQNKSIEERAQKAINFFEQGYNCSQSVLMAYADLYSIDQETATKFASSFGGGMGRLREVCGAVSGNRKTQRHQNEMLVTTLYDPVVVVLR